VSTAKTFCSAPFSTSIQSAGKDQFLELVNDTERSVALHVHTASMDHDAIIFNPDGSKRQHIPGFGHWILSVATALVDRKDLAIASQPSRVT
jgi:hypothetical protein